MAAGVVFDEATGTLGEPLIEEMEWTAASAG